MKNLRLIVKIAVIPIFLLSGCTQPVKPPTVNDVLSYTVECSDSTHKVDVSYRDNSNAIINLTDQTLPWTVSTDLTSVFTGEAYLKAQIPSSEVFVPFAVGNADSFELRKLNDSGASFIADGVIAGDRVYIDPTSAEYADIISVVSDISLSLNTNLFAAGNEAYNLYHQKTLTVTISLNGETVDENEVESERILNCSLLTLVSRD